MCRTGFSSDARGRVTDVICIDSSSVFTTSVSRHFLISCLVRPARPAVTPPCTANRPRGLQEPLATKSTSVSEDTIDTPLIRPLCGSQFNICFCAD
ncbi:hypothetical protein BaRGS_00005339 [Batillaria attramentaria]|uniref:Uncharacterized protein n=1 Tax=Batillaria attramentaria TaxID=370345 RepID=A0ABD0LWE3_9CAEN